MTERQEPSIPPTYKDRRTGLIVFGILEIAFGGLALLMALLLVVVATAATKLDTGAANGMDATMMAPGILLHALIGAWFITMGVGSMLARRWARALLLVSSWIWLVSGVSASIAMITFMPRIYEQMAETGQLPREAAIAAKYVMAGFVFVFFLLIPGTLVLFYQSGNVKATCESRDTHLRWTDKCPLPVLAVSLMLVSWAGAMPMIGAYHWAIPCFGRILTGPPAFAIVLVIMAVSLSLAWGVYRLNMNAWWGTVGLILAYTASAGITFSQVTILEFYEKMGFPEQQMDMMRQMELPQGWVVTWMLVWLGVFLGYLLYTKRYFTAPK
ncbi:MAG: hypothetical protein HZB26_09300 [Candidatus Hydrogenedentes bacterium]|nr:hypothetical protein [Candidatus Hydrogenedentota bacterium]